MLEIIKTNIFRKSVLASALLLCVLALPGVANASIYGNTKYGECAYGYGCSPPTVVTAPSGLEVSINLHDGQVIPRSGYTVIVTPINGQGRTFDHVEFWLDGVLIHTANPGSNGTATWDWDPVEFPGAKMTVIVYDTDGSKIIEEFDLVIGPDETSGDGTSAPGGTTDPSSPDSTSDTSQNIVARAFQSVGTFFGNVGNAFEETFSGALEAAKELFMVMPAPVVFIFPYFLLLMILVNIALFLLQARREVSEYVRLREILERGQAVTESKKTLAQLVSHYLRTPLTLMMGGVDMLKTDPAAQSAIAEFEEICTRLHAKVEALIAQTVDGTAAAPVIPDTKTASVWKQRGLFMPLVITPLILIPYNYVAASAGNYTASQIGLAAQIILFSILITFLYITLRQRQLRLRNAAHIQQIIEAEEAINRSRDALITDALGTLEGDISQIDALLERVGDNPAAEFLRTGQTRFNELLSRLRVANRLRGLHSEVPPSDVTFSEIAARAMTPAQEKAGAKGIQLHSDGDAHLRIQSPDLVAYVIQSLVDNAVAYSDDNQPVDLRIAQDGRDAVLSVTDRGAGISEQDVAQLFQPFNKVEGAEVFTHEGMGFSLYLDKLIANYVGGSMEVHSTPRGETTFSLRVPNQIVQ